MSHWSYIDGCVTVSPPGRTQAEMQYILETVLDHLPSVTGSERDMLIHVVKKYGHDTSCSYNEFCEPAWLRRYNWNGTRYMDMQSKYILVLEGRLRDREFRQTLREFSKWIFRLSKRIYVEDVLVRVSDSENEYLFNEGVVPIFKDELFRSLSEYPAWWDYLMWEADENSGYPKKLAEKYQLNEVTDTDV